MESHVELGDGVGSSLLCLVYHFDDGFFHFLGNAGQSRRIGQGFQHGGWLYHADFGLAMIRIDRHAAWQREVHIHICGQDFLSILWIANFKDSAGVLKIHTFILQRLLQIVDMQYTEFMALNRSTQICFCLIHGFLGFHDVFYFVSSASPGSA